MKSHWILLLYIIHRMPLSSTKLTTCLWKYSPYYVADSDPHGQFFWWRAKIQNLPCTAARQACKYCSSIAPYIFYQSVSIGTPLQNKASPKLSHNFAPLSEMLMDTPGSNQASTSSTSSEDDISRIDLRDIGSPTYHPPGSVRIERSPEEEKRDSPTSGTPRLPSDDQSS